MTHRSRLAAFLAALLVAMAALAGPAAADDHDDEGRGGSFTGADTEAVALNTTDNSSIFRLAFEVIRVSDGVVDQTNAAVAYAECEACKAVAASFQIVLVSGDVDTVAPQNASVALNVSCTACETMAAAYQFVVGTPGPMRFTGEGRRRLAHLQAGLLDAGRRFEAGELTVAELQAALAAAAEEIRAVLDTELVPIRDDDDDDSDDEEADEDEEADVVLDDDATTTTSPPTTDGTTTTSTSTTTTSTTTTTGGSNG